MEKAKTRIVIIDDELLSRHPLIIKLREYFETVELYKKASEAIDMMKKHLGEKMILILDMKLSGNEEGYQVLSELRGLSYQIPVIVWTGISKENGNFFDMINLKPYATRDKTEKIEEMVRLVKKADADIEYSLPNALEKWLLAQPVENPDAPYLISTGGKTYSLNEILDEVRKDTAQGKEFTQDLVNLTIELMARKDG